MSQYGAESVGDNIEFTAVDIDEYLITFNATGTDTATSKFASGNTQTARKFAIRTDKNVDLIEMNAIIFTEDRIEVTAFHYRVGPLVKTSDGQGGDEIRRLPMATLPWSFAWDMLIHRFKFWISHPLLLDFFLPDIIFGFAVLFTLINEWPHLIYFLQIASIMLIGNS